MNMSIALLLALILIIAEIFLCKKTKKMSLIIPIITGVYLLYSCYQVVRFQDLMFMDMLPALIFFISSLVTFVVCKIIVKK